MKPIEILNRMRNFIKSGALDKVTSRAQAFDNVVSFIYNDAKKVDGEMAIGNIESKVSDIKRVISEIKTIVTSKAINQDIIMFLKDVLMFIWNWNNNIAKDISIAQDAQLLDKILDGRKTLEELIDEAKSLAIEMRKIKNMHPSYIDMSKHYLESLFKE